MIWCSPPADQPYSSEIYDPFWAAAQDLDMPVSLHAITGMERIPWEYGAEQRAMRSTVTPTKSRNPSASSFFPACWNGSRA